MARQAAPPKPSPAADAATIDAMVARYSDAIAAQVAGCRARMQARVPRGWELVYDNYNALVFAYAWADKAPAAVVSIAAYPRWVTLFFADGRALHDPERLLQGDGARIRGVRLATADDLERPAVQSLLAQALQPHAAAFAAAPPRWTLVKASAAKQRPRRPA